MPHTQLLIRLKTAGALLLSLGLLSACATRPAAETASAEGRQCFLPAQVNGFDSQDDRLVHVTVSANDVYALQLFGACPDVDWSHRIGIRSAGGGSWICQGYDAELLVPGPGGVRTCQVTNVRKLSTAEVEAYRAGRR